MIDGYIYYPPYRDICDHEGCCLGFVEGKYSAVPCPNCKDYTGFTMHDMVKILYDSMMPWDQFTLRVRHYSMGIDLKNKCMVDMDTVFHQAALKKAKEKEEQDKKNQEEKKKIFKEKVEQAKKAVDDVLTTNYGPGISSPMPKPRPKPKPEEKLDLREVALGALFKNGGTDE